MFPSIKNTKIFLCRQPTDMRKSYDTLAALASSELEEDPLSGALFVFLNRPRNRVKILYYESGGFCLWMKRLEAGSFPLPLGEGRKQEINAVHLAMLLDGLKIVKMKRFSRRSD
ncbi:MAG: IS66 family insertion sequence element accessory protein TnpB [Victivallaceae bacterium]|nr:IS66 family insertion sequence element accessory protein TnpB [Victivallaceae bacterium]